MRASATVIAAAALGSIGAGLTAILLTFGYRTGTSWMCALILDCFGHRRTPWVLVNRNFDAGNWALGFSAVGFRI